MAEELSATRMRLNVALAEAKSLSIQNGYLRTELVEAREELKGLSHSRVEAYT
jgi:hypothetical protein